MRLRIFRVAHWLVDVDVDPTRNKLASLLVGALSSLRKLTHLPQLCCGQG